METVNITIDGRPYTVEKGIPLLLAAERAGVRIPHLCYYEGTSVFAGCRVCVVQIEGARGMPTSCTTPTAEGQIVSTKTPEVLEMQRNVMSLIMADHPDRCLTCHRQKHCGINDICLRDSVVTYRCLTCAKNKRCEFQSATEELEMYRFPMRYYQERHSWYGPDHVETPIRRDNPFIELDFNECILCARCIRTCDEIRGLGCYELSNKGPQARIDTSFGLPLQQVGCDACGACIDACPVNTIMDRPSKWAGPSQRTVTTTCPQCGDGCQLDIETRSERILRVVPSKEGPANHGFASNRGRYALGYVNSPDRLTTPLIRRDGALTPATWDEALNLIASRLDAACGEAFGALASPLASNEENWVLQKFTRQVMGSNNIDQYARLDEYAFMEPVRAALGYPAMTGSLEDIAEARCLLIFASDTPVTHPIAALRGRQQARFRGGTLIVANSRETEMDHWAQQSLRYRPGTEPALAAGLLKAVLDAGGQNQEFVVRCRDYARLEASLAGFTVARAAETTGVPAAEIAAAAQAFASSSASTVLFDAGINRHGTGGDAVAALVDLALLTGNLGRPGAGIAALRGGSNQQGADDLGCRPVWGPAYEPVARPGLDARAMLDAAGPVKAMLLADIDPAADDPRRAAVVERLRALDFLVVLAHHVTPTAALADVVLPVATFAEQDGTLTSTERRIQPLHKIFELPGGCRPGWAALRDLGARMGAPDFNWPAPAAVMEEIARSVPFYGGVSYARLAQESLQWPCPEPAHPGTPRFEYAEAAPAFVAFSPESAPPPAATAAAYPFLLAPGRDLLAYHKEVLAAEGDPTSPPYDHALCLSPDDGAALDVDTGDYVRITTQAGASLVTRVQLSDDVPAGVPFFTVPVLEDPAPLASGLAAEALAALPSLSVGPARIEKAATTST